MRSYDTKSILLLLLDQDASKIVLFFNISSYTNDLCDSQIRSDKIATGVGYQDLHGEAQCQFCAPGSIVAIIREYENNRCGSEDT